MTIGTESLQIIRLIVFMVAVLMMHVKLASFSNETTTLTLAPAKRKIRPLLGHAAMYKCH